MRRLAIHASAQEHPCRQDNRHNAFAHKTPDTESVTIQGRNNNGKVRVRRINLHTQEITTSHTLEVLHRQEIDRQHTQKGGAQCVRPAK